MKRLQATCFVALLMWAVAPMANTDDIDRAFGAQRKPAKSEVKVDGSVGEAAQTSRAGVAERATAREEARSRELSRASQPSTETRSEGGRGTASASRSTSSAIKQKRFVCQYVCSNEALLTYKDKAHRSVIVDAPDQKAAVAKAIETANASCFRETRMILDAGSASCRAD